MAVIEPNSIPEGLAFDDVLLRPGLSAVMPSATNIGTQLTRTIRLNLPIISAAMDTVTEVQTRDRDGARQAGSASSTAIFAAEAIG